MYLHYMILSMILQETLSVMLSSFLKYGKLEEL